MRKNYKSISQSEYDTLDILLNRFDSKNIVNKKPTTKNKKPILYVPPKKLKGKGVSPWITHVKNYQKQHLCSYREALKNAKHTYRGADKV